MVFSHSDRGRGQGFRGNYLIKPTLVGGGGTTVVDGGAAVVYGVELIHNWEVKLEGFYETPKPIERDNS